MAGPSSIETLEPPASRRDTDARDVVLTLLYHRDLSRVGEVARLCAADAAGSARLSRDEPVFAPVRGDASGPLGDPHLSRRPVTFTPSGDDLTLDIGDAPHIALNGAPASGRIVLARADLRGGVVIEMAKSVVLLLHAARRRAPGQEAPPALGLVGENDAIDDLRHNITRVADLDVPVLVRGETGTGKELCAEAIHAAGARASQPFVSVNMAAILPTTAASTLFGHRRGAFTGAVNDHAGYFEQAGAGTLFLDEIGATPADVQPILLRALEAREIQPLGSSTTRRFDARVVAATDADLEAAIADESFRAALLHRLEGFQLPVPPLRERRDDIGRLLVHFLRAELAETGELGRLDPVPHDRAPWLPASLVAELARLDWPGNVRQLRNVARQLVISSRGSPNLRIDAATARMLEAANAAPGVPDNDAPRGRAGGVTDEALIEALRAVDWQPNKAAARLGIARSTMYERMRRSPLIKRARDLTRDEIAGARAACDGDTAAMARHLEVSEHALKLRIGELEG